jgi:hypothetical protein
MMAIPTGLAAQLGVAEETTYGAPVTVTRFYEFTDEALKNDIERLESAGLRAGTRIQRSDRWAAGRKTVGGPVNMELANKSFGLLLKHMFGTIGTTQPNAGDAPTVYDHTFTPGDLSVGLTMQIGRPDLGGTVRPFTYHGCTLPSWEVDCSVGELAKLRLDVSAEDEDTGVALATASYPADLKLLTFVHGSLTIGGVAQLVRSATIRGDNGLAVNRHALGSALIKKPLEGGMREYGGQLDAHFDDLTAYTRYVAGTEAALVLVFAADVIEYGYQYTLRFTCNVRFDGETPQVAGPEELEQPLAFKCLDTGTGPGTAITALYRTTGVTP